MRGLRRIGQKLTDYTLDETPFKVVELRKAGMVLKQYEQCAKRKLRDFPADQLPKLQQQIDMLTEDSIQKFVEGEITRQLVHMFRYIQQNHQHHTEATSNHITPTSTVRKMPFSLEIKPSTIPNAGDGVFVRLTSSNAVDTNDYLRPGTVVALCPGLVHLKEHLNDRTYLKSLLPDPDFLLQTRLDQMIIDARKLSQIPMPSPNPFAVAHKINHGVLPPSSADASQAPKGVHPNVIQVTYNYPDSEDPAENFPVDLRPWIPNRYARMPSEKSIQDLGFGKACMHGLVVVTTEKLHDGDELFMDYRLHPEAGEAGLWPAWYAPYDAKHTERRWHDQKKYL